jgi:heat shock protein HtpX
LFIASLVLAPLIAQIIQLAISRKREFQADATGVLVTRHPEALARALEKIDQFPHPMQHVSSSVSHLFLTSPLKSDEDDKNRKWLAGLFDTHPPIQERIKLLRKM